MREPPAGGLLLPPRRRPVAAILVALALSACASGSSALPRSNPSVASLSPPPGASGGSTGTVSVGDCPVDEPRFCQEASALANALTQSNAEAVLTLSRPERFDCAALDQDRFPQCEDEDLLRGYAIADYQGNYFVVTANQQQDNLEFFVEAIDDEYSDELGGAEMQILGVSTCGGEDGPSYHLVYTAGLGDPNSTFPGDRFLGTYEFTQRDREWAIAVAHFGLLTDWELVLDEPLSQIACGGIQAWG
ncbi:MAG: hypothetical protein ACRDHU_12685 [Actinomycetota bacterium]